jgi:uroporphyrinogen-III decarboxylase
MTSRERILAAYAHRPVDRIPCSPRIYAFLLELYGQCGIDAHLRAQEEFGFDVHANPGIFDHVTELGVSPSYHLPDVEYRREESTEGAYKVVRRIFRTRSGTVTDVTRFPPPDRVYGVSPNPIRTEHLIKSHADLDCARHLITDKSRTDFAPLRAQEKRVGERGLVSLDIRSPISHRAAEAYGMENLMVAYYEDRRFFDELLALYHGEMMDEVRIALAAGVKHFFANWFYNSMSTGWSPAIWRNVFAPQLSEMTSAVHAAGGDVNLYDDGKCMAIVDILAGCGIDVLTTLTPPPVGDVDLAEVKRRIGDKVCLMGYVDLHYVIKMGTPDLIARTVRAAIETAGPTGFVLGTSDSIRDGTPIENVRSYFDAARKYGKPK